MDRRRQADRPDPVAGEHCQSVLWRSQAKPPVHGRQPVALRGLPQNPRGRAGVTYVDLGTDYSSDIWYRLSPLRLRSTLASPSGPCDWHHRLSEERAIETEEPQRWPAACRHDVRPPPGETRGAFGAHQRPLPPLLRGPAESLLEL